MQQQRVASSSSSDRAASTNELPLMCTQRRALTQYQLVREALSERETLMRLAPHLSRYLPIMLPIYSWWKLPYFYAGLVAYDMIAGPRNTHRSYIMSRAQVLEAFPMVKAEGEHGTAAAAAAAAVAVAAVPAAAAAAAAAGGGSSSDRSILMPARSALRYRCTIRIRMNKRLATPCVCAPPGLKGAVVYFDGMQNDSRVNVSLAMTAAAHGAVVANYCEVEGLLRDESSGGGGRLRGARVRDLQGGGAPFDVRARVVVNAGGPFTDEIRAMGAAAAGGGAGSGGSAGVAPICQPSSGTHVVLPKYFTPDHMGLLDPATSDGRVVFFLPWEGETIVGTTDVKCGVSRLPVPTEEEVEFILKEVSKCVRAGARVLLLVVCHHMLCLGVSLGRTRFKLFELHMIKNI